MRIPLVCQPFFKLLSALFTRIIAFLRHPLFLKCAVQTLLLYGIVFCVILPIVCCNLPLTKYFRNDRKTQEVLIQAKSLNYEFGDKAESKLAGLWKGSTKQLYEESKNSKNLNVIIGVLTIARPAWDQKPPRYLTQVMVALHDVISQNGLHEEVGLFICNAHRPPDDHTEAAALSEYFPTVDVPNISKKSDHYEREKEDYVFCLKEAQKVESRYILLLQDDALPHPDFYSVLDSVVKNKLEKQICQGAACSASDDFLWLKLNFPNSLAKYDRNYFFALEWVSLSIILSCVSTLVGFPVGLMDRIAESVIHVCSRRERRRLPVAMVFLFNFAFWMLVAWTLGRSYVNLPRSYFKHAYFLGPGTSCCLPAILFPQAQVQGILDYLESHKATMDVPLDFALDRYRIQSNLRQYLLSPNLFSHIGFVSALHRHSNLRSAENYHFVMRYLSRRYPDLYPWPLL